MLFVTLSDTTWTEYHYLRIRLPLIHPVPIQYITKIKSVEERYKAVRRGYIGSNECSFTLENNDVIKRLKTYSINNCSLRSQKCYDVSMNCNKYIQNDYSYWNW